MEELLMVRGGVDVLKDDEEDEMLNVDTGDGS